MQSIKPQELHKKLTDGDIDEILIDVRDPFEFKGKHIHGSKNIPLDTIEDSIEKLRSIKTVYVHCQSGNRSSQACETFQKSGLNVINLEGGISAWEDAGFDVEDSGTVQDSFSLALFISFHQNSNIFQIRFNRFIGDTQPVVYKTAEEIRDFFRENIDILFIADDLDEISSWR